MVEQPKGKNMLRHVEGMTRLALTNDLSRLLYINHCWRTQGLTITQLNVIRYKIGAVLLEEETAELQINDFNETNTSHDQKSHGNTYYIQ